MTTSPELTSSPAKTREVSATGSNNPTTVPPAEDEGFFEWNNKNITFRLREALKAEEDEKYVYAIMARPDIDNTFEYQGKTLEEYYSDMIKERDYPEILSQLLKDGDSLKYGKALYETGAPNGEKWSKELYEERIAYYGSTILEKYIVNGHFLRNELEKDIEKARNKKDAAAAYDQARKAYLEKLAESLSGSFSTEVNYEKNSIVIYLTKSELESFTVNNIDEWIFDLAVDSGDDEEYVRYD